MAIDLISLVSRYLTPQLVSQIASVAGVDPDSANKLISGAVPAVLASLGGALAAPGGAQKVSDAISNADPDLLTKLSSALGSGQLSLLNEGATRAERPDRGERPLEPRDRARTTRRHSARGRAIRRRRRKPGCARRHRATGSLELVRSRRDHEFHRQPEEFDHGGVAARPFHAPQLLRPARWPRRARRRRGGEGDLRRHLGGFERDRPRLRERPRPLRRASNRPSPPAPVFRPG